MQARSPTVPLTQVVFNCVVQEALSQTEVTQTFRNVENNPIECEYVFPLMEDGALSHMTVQTDDGKVLEAVVEDLEEAKERYSDAISAGNQAVLGRMETEDRMVLNIGNMAPKSKVEVKFTVVQPVKCEGKEWLFLLPAALLPLYNLGKSLEEFGLQGEVEPADLLLVTPYQCTYKFHFHLHITNSSEITSIQCKSHPVLITKSENGKEATVTTDPHVSFAPNKDFRVTYETVDSMVPHVHVQYDPKTQEYAGMLSFIPPLIEVGEVAEELTGSGEFLFILDRSGSMSGARIEMAKEAALLFIKSLPPSSQFNILSFGSDTQSLFPSSREYNSKTVKAALTSISGFSADMGGTNILLPLDESFRDLANLNCPRAVFLLTDGAVSNPEAVIGFVEAHSKQARFFPFGIGDGVSRNFLKTLAQVGNGAAQFISDPSDISSSVISILQKCVAPALVDNKLHWPSDQIVQYPSNERIPTCYFGEVFTVLTHFGRVSPTPGSIVRLTSNSSKTGFPVSFEIVIGNAVSEGEDVHNLWARQAIKELFFRHKRTLDPMWKSEVIEISKRFGVPSLYTAWICVERRTSPETGEMQLRKVPILTGGEIDKRLVTMSYSQLQRGPQIFDLNRVILEGKTSEALAEQTLRELKSQRETIMRRYEKVQDVCANITYAECFSPRSKARASCFGGSGHSSSTRSQRANKVPDSPLKVSSFKATETVRVSAVSKLSAENKIPNSSLLRILSCQDIDGHWTPGSLAGLVPVVKMPKDFEARFGDASETLWTTLCTIVYLTVKYAQKEGEWKLIYLKAKKYLKSFQVETNEFQERIVASLG